MHLGIFVCFLYIKQPCEHERRTQNIVKEIVKAALDAYFLRCYQEYGSFPKDVRIKGMDIPHFSVDYGKFGEWKPEEATFSIPKEDLDELCDGNINEELYEYYRYWRFASLEVKNKRIKFIMSPIFETIPNKTNFFFAMDINEELYFKIGIAEGLDDLSEYTVFVRNGGGVYLLEGGALKPWLFCERISDLLISM